MTTRLPAIPDVSGAPGVPLVVKQAILAIAARIAIREAELPNSVSRDRVVTGKVGQSGMDTTSTDKVFTDSIYGRALADNILILNANIKGQLKSDDYIQGQSGWMISKTGNGSAEFNNTTTRGTMLGGDATDYSTGTGLFAGLDAGTYKFRVGIPGGARFQWDGSALNVYDASGNLTINQGQVQALKPATQVAGYEHLQDNSATREVFAYTSSASATGAAFDWTDAISVTFSDSDVTGCVVDATFDYEAGAHASGNYVLWRVVDPDSTQIGYGSTQADPATAGAKVGAVALRVQGSVNGTYKLQVSKSNASTYGSFSNVGLLARAAKR